MSIVYNPSAVIRSTANKKNVKKALKKDLTLKKNAFRFASLFADVVDKALIVETALKALKAYKERIDKMEKEKKEKLKKELLANPALLVNRVQSEVLFQVSEKIKDKYKGERYRWLPSDADEPDPEHQLNYGKVFTVGVGEMPGERYGCKCGMEILVDDKKLDLK